MGIVASTNEVASKRRRWGHHEARHGNAVDALLAVCFRVGGNASGRRQSGWPGFHDDSPKDGWTTAIDYREMAPAGAPARLSRLRTAM